MDSRQQQVIVRPIVNEKTVQLAAENQQYTFEVAKDSNKTEIAEALKQILNDLYPKGKFTVLRVNTSAIRDRFRRSKRHARNPKDGKKAIVTVAGDPIEIFSA
jgi:large subunit ribosomal protein L23